VALVEVEYSLSLCWIATRWSSLSSDAPSLITCLGERRELESYSGEPTNSPHRRPCTERKRSSPHRDEALDLLLLVVLAGMWGKLRWGWCGEAKSCRGICP